MPSFTSRNCRLGFCSGGVALLFANKKQVTFIALISLFASVSELAAADLVTCKVHQTCDMSGTCTSDEREIQLVREELRISHVRNGAELRPLAGIDRILEQVAHAVWRDSSSIMNSISISTNGRFIWLQSSDLFRTVDAPDNTTTSTGVCEAGW